MGLKLDRQTLTRHSSAIISRSLHRFHYITVLIMRKGKAHTKKNFSWRLAIFPRNAFFCLVINKRKKLKKNNLICELFPLFSKQFPIFSSISERKCYSDSSTSAAATGLLRQNYQIDRCCLWDKTDGVMTESAGERFASGAACWGNVSSNSLAVSPPNFHPRALFSFLFFENLINTDG